MTAICLALALAAFPVHAEEQGRLETRTVRHLGLERSFLVYLPESYRAAAKAPVILVFHGGGGSADAEARAGRLREIAEREGVILVYPQGTGKRLLGKTLGTWNAGRCCGSARDEGVDDVGFVAKLIDLVVGEFGADTRRIYSTGLSNGAQMSYRLACDLSDRIAAIAPIASQGVEPACSPKRPVPVIHFHGTKDPCALYKGGRCGGCFAGYLKSLGLPAKKDRRDRWECEPVPKYVEGWAERNSCKEGPRVTLTRGHATCKTWSRCAENADVVLCSIEGHGHVWPGGGYGTPACERNPDGRLCRNFQKISGPAVDDLVASDVMWEFLKRQRLP